MKTITVAEAQHDFGRFLDDSMKEAVVITRNNEAVAVLLSLEELEDRVLGEAARIADKSGYIGKNASARLMDDLKNA